MGLFDHFPYTNVHELNLDWILSMMKALEAEWEAFTAGNSLTFADPLLHDVTKTYAKNTIVLDGNGNAYVSLQAVPVGVGLQNGDYWLMVFDYEAFIEKVNKNFTARYYRGSYRATTAMAIGDWLTVDDVLYKAAAAIAVDDVLEDGVNITHFTLEDFIKAFMQSANQLIQQYKNEIDASELLYRQQLAQDIANTTASLQAQLDLAISGASVDSEVINARLGADGITYPTLGDADRTQFTKLNLALFASSIINDPTYTTNTGGFYNRDGELRSDAVYSYTDPIELKAGTTIIVQATGYSNNVAIVAECDANGGSISVEVLSIDNTNRVYSWYTDHDTYVCISFKNTVPVEILTVNDITALKEFLIGIENYPTLTPTSGYYYTAAGDLKTSANYSYTDPIAVGAGTIVIAHGRTNANIALACTCDSNGDNRKPVILPPDDVVRNYVYIAPENTYLTFSYFTNDNLTVQTYNGGAIQVYYIDGALAADSEINVNLDAIRGEKISTPAYTLTSGYFINRAGAKSVASDYYYSSPIAVSAGTFIKVMARGYLQNVAIISTCDNAGNYITPVVMSVDSTYRMYSYIMPTDGYIMISYNGSKYHSIEMYYLGPLGDLGVRVSDLDDTGAKSYNILSAFNNITCCGDSLTYSSVFTSNNTNRQAYTTYPEKLAVMTGATVESLAAGGYNASDWWSTFGSDITPKANQLAIIYLGTNDGLTDTMDTDMPGSNPDNWANTYTADYGRIIDKFLDVGARVLLVKVYGGANRDITNVVIDKMATRFSVAVVDNPRIEDMKFHRYPDDSGYNTNHYNDFGYQVFTDQLVRRVSNLNDTMMIRLIPN